ncbi:hypothetical protein [Streptomyces microflavus]|uniref:hypothetical protein n=1 Tax=Streptomyces microflavus TaxID=1919 RepID=UPI0033D00847
MRPSDADISLRHTDVGLLRTVLDYLEGPFAAARLTAGLTVLLRGGDGDSTRTLKDLTDRIVFHRLLHHLRKGRFAGGAGLLAVVGADHLWAGTPWSPWPGPPGPQECDWSYSWSTCVRTSRTRPEQ